MCRHSRKPFDQINRQTGLVLQGLQAINKLSELLVIISGSNAALRWLLLHPAGPQLSKVAAAVAKQNIDKAKLCALLLDVAYLESWVSQDKATCMYTEGYKVYDRQVPY